jgi:hypothetical protein
MHRLWCITRMSLSPTLWQWPICEQLFLLYEMSVTVSVEGKLTNLFATSSFLIGLIGGCPILNMMTITQHAGLQYQTADTILCKKTFYSKGCSNNFAVLGYRSLSSSYPTVPRVPRLGNVGDEPRQASVFAGATLRAGVQEPSISIIINLMFCRTYISDSALQYEPSRIKLIDS